MTQDVDLRQPNSSLGNGDYAHGVVHLAWDLDEKSTRTLLFACVELLPVEVPPPIDNYDKEASRVRLGSGSKHHAYVRHVVVSADEALRWYEACRHGTALRPDDHGTFEDATRTFVLADLVEEPRWPELVCDPESEFPFTAPWHLSPRMHHLVPKATARPPIWTDAEFARAAEYLAEDMPINLRHFVELWGSVHLVAPNPVLREIRETRETTDDGECLIVELVPRSGVPLTNLQLVVREDRPTGTFAMRIVGVDKARLRLQFGHEVANVSMSVIDGDRGPLYLGHSRTFLRQMQLGLAMVSATREVVVAPSRKRKEDRYSVGVVHGKEVSLVDPKYVPGVAVSRLLEGHFRRETRSLAARLDQTWFDNDADAAAQRLRDLIKPASECVLIVDPYFTARELRRFAFAASDTKVRIEILTSAEGMKEIARREDAARRGVAIRAQEMALELARALSASHSNPTEVRVMGGSRPPIHDRFLLVDETLWSLGASLNEFGARGSLMLKVPDPVPITEKLRAAWDKAQELAKWVAENVEPL